MELNKNACVFYKDGDKSYLAKTTDLCFSAHQDDIEIMALELYAPFFLYYSVSLSLDEIKPVLQRHIDTFFEKYFQREFVFTITLLITRNLVCFLV